MDAKLTSLLSLHADTLKWIVGLWFSLYALYCLYQYEQKLTMSLNPKCVQTSNNYTSDNESCLDTRSWISNSTEDGLISIRDYGLSVEQQYLHFWSENLGLSQVTTKNLGETGTHKLVAYYRDMVRTYRFAIVVLDIKK